MHAETDTQISSKPSLDDLRCAAMEAAVAGNTDKALDGLLALAMALRFDRQMLGEREEPLQPAIISELRECSRIATALVNTRYRPGWENPKRDTILDLTHTYYKEPYQDGRRLFLSAAEDGVPDAMFMLAYSEAQNETPGAALIKRWLEKAAARGHARAMARLGYYCLYGHFMERNQDKAVLWFRRAADAGDADAHFHLGELIENNRLIVTNPPGSMMEHYRRAVALDSDHGKAHFRLGFYYYTGIKGVPMNKERAANHFFHAARQGSRFGIGYSALHYLRDCFAIGAGVLQSDFTAGNLRECGYIFDPDSSLTRAGFEMFNPERHRKPGAAPTAEM